MSAESDSSSDEDHSKSPQPDSQNDTQENGQQISQQDQDQNHQKAASTRSALKRRTKTGCLTCRKRRIKCDESRPVCRNCLKSKRDCAGYNPSAPQRQLAGQALPPPSAIQFAHYLHHVDSSSQSDGRSADTGTSAYQPRKYDEEAPYYHDTTGAQGFLHTGRHFAHETHLASANSTGTGNDYIADPPLWQSTRPKYGRHDTHNTEDLCAIEVVQTRGPSNGLPGYDGEQTYHFPDTDIVHWKPAVESSPLFEARNARILHHYLNVVAPLMGVFARWGAQSQPAKLIWNTSIVSMAVSHHALAHALLGIAAMHMSKLDVLSKEVATKHFTFATRRVQKLLSHDATRLQIPTLAAILILGFLEVIGGDHSRWSLHLSGASTLVMEHDYIGLIRAIKKMNAAAKTSMQATWNAQGITPGLASTSDPLQVDGDWDVDASVVSQMLGQQVDYEHLQEHEVPHESSGMYLSQAHIEDIRVLVELFWWYYKQDVFQALLSGDSTMLSASQQQCCPPRGKLGDVDRAYASVDYLWLILGRLVAFGARDRPRKLKVVERQGGNWIPAPGFLNPRPGPATFPTATATGPASQAPGSSNGHHSIKPPPMANEGRARRTKSTHTTDSTPAAPPMYGMMPIESGSINMSPSFRAMEAELRKGDDPNTKVHTMPDIDDLEAATRLALREHTAIASALDFFEASLGSGFQPIENAQTHMTPCGPAIYYATPQIATIWTFYHVARIVLRRMHPFSPPAAMVSTVVNAQFTAKDAFTIARICGGMYEQYNRSLHNGYRDFSLLSGLTESTFSMLFAGVQFQESQQRHWTISKLSELALTAGWESSYAIAAACETAWEKMGIAERGPPYTRTLDRSHQDTRIQLRSLHTLSFAPTPPMSPVDEHESRFVSHDRNLIDRHVSTRTYWAVGLMAIDDDLKKMGIGEKKN